MEDVNKKIIVPVVLKTNLKKNKSTAKSEFSRYNEVKPFNVFPEGVKICSCHRGQIDLPAAGRINFEFSKDSTIDLVSIKNIRLKVSSGTMQLCGEHECGLDGYIHAQFRANTVISFDVATSASTLSWELDVPDGSAVKFGVTFQLDMVATANCSRQKLESYVSCDKRIAKFNGINLRLKEKIVSKIPIQLQQLDQQIQGQYQDFRRRFDHYIAQYTEILQTSLPSAPPAFPLPGPEVPIPTTSESVITQCREELASACSLHAQSERLLQSMLSDQTHGKLSKDLQSLLNTRQQICQSIVKCNILFISKAKKTLENYVTLLGSRCVELQKTFKDWRADANKELRDMFLKHVDSRNMDIKAQHDRLWDRWLQTKQQLNSKQQTQLSKIRKSIVELSSRQK